MNAKFHLNPYGSFRDEVSRLRDTPSSLGTNFMRFVETYSFGVNYHLELIPKPMLWFVKEAGRTNPRTSIHLRR